MKNNLEATLQDSKEKEEDVALQQANNLCSICIQPLGLNMAPFANLLECGHSFCMADLKVWISRNTACPLCKHQILNVQEVQPEVKIQLSIDEQNIKDQKIQLLKKTWNIEQIVSSQTRHLNKKQDLQKEPANLDCLDHFYFKKQIQKLCSMRTRIQTQKFLKRGGNGVQPEWIALQCMKTRLQQIKYQNSKFMFFDPNELMIELTGLAQLLNDVKTGKLQNDGEQQDDFYDKNTDQQNHYNFQQFMLTPEDAFGKSHKGGSVKIFQNGKFKKAKKNHQFICPTQQKLGQQCDGGGGGGSIQFTSNKSLKKKKKNKNKKGIELKVW